MKNVLFNFVREVLEETVNACSASAVSALAIAFELGCVEVKIRWQFFAQFAILMRLFLIFCRYEYINVVFFVSHWIAMSNSCYNPFIYAIFSVSLRVFCLKKTENTFSEPDREILNDLESLNV